MAKNLGSSGGSATLQRSKLSNARVESKSSPKLDDGMGGGGIGKGIFNGGGGDGDGGDDDDYFNEVRPPSRGADARLPRPPAVPCLSAAPAAWLPACPC